MTFQKFTGLGRHRQSLHGIPLHLAGLTRVALDVRNMDAVGNNPQSSLIQGFPVSLLALSPCTQGVWRASGSELSPPGAGEGQTANTRLLCDGNPLPKPTHGGLCLLHQAACSSILTLENFGRAQKILHTRLGSFALHCSQGPG